ncbi:MAG: hypothetical protein JWQ30_819 [Sediminibacterium sp.]|nr:hypothetical protein [Sediminibacterium sp.]
MKTARQLSVVILLLLDVSALYGSYCMIMDPTGNSLGAPFYLLNGTVFSDYAIIGWILLFTVGIFSSFILLLIFFKSTIYSFFVILQGVILCIFIFVQILLIRKTFILQYAFLLMAISLIALGALQNQGKIIGEVDNPKRKRS